jgi:hypothetical protein
VESIDGPGDGAVMFLVDEFLSFGALEGPERRWVI